MGVYESCGGLTHLSLRWLLYLNRRLWVTHLNHHRGHTYLFSGPLQAIHLGAYEWPCCLHYSLQGCCIPTLLDLLHSSLYLLGQALQLLACLGQVFWHCFCAFPLIFYCENSPCPMPPPCYRPQSPVLAHYRVGCLCLRCLYYSRLKLCQAQAVLICFPMHHEFFCGCTSSSLLLHVAGETVPQL